MTYKATRNDGGQAQNFESFAEAAEWVADGVEFETVENGPDSTYIFPEGSGSNNDCLGAVDEIED